MGNDEDDACALCNHVGHLLWHLIGRPPRGSQRYLRIIGRDLRIIGYVRHGVWRQGDANCKVRFATQTEVGMSRSVEWVRPMVGGLVGS